MARVSSLAVLTAVLAPAIGDAIVGAQLTSEGCTTNSFTTPSWLVQDIELQRSANLTVASFNALNRATNISIELSCSSSKPAAGWQDCKATDNTEQALVATFRADNATAWVRFNETWSCSDLTPSDPITFSAIGNSSVSLDCSVNEDRTTTCRGAKPVLVKAALSSPIKVTPSYVSGPAGHDAEGCAAESKTPAWEVTASQINLRNISGARRSGNAFIIIRNDHLGYTVSCGGPLTGASGPHQLTCSGQVAVRRPNKYEIETDISFDPDTFVLAINQTWYCDDQDPVEPVAVTASGTTQLSLNCNVFNGTAPSAGSLLSPLDVGGNGTSNGNSTTFCTGGTDGAFEGDKDAISRVPLPSYSLNDPLATADGCTVSSILTPGWWLHDFVTNTTFAHNDTVTARFGMELGRGGLRPTGRFATVAADGVRYSATNGSIDDMPWNECVLEGVGDVALAPTGCEFRYEMASRFLGLRVQWACDDLEKGNPVAFTGEVRTEVPEFTCVTSGKEVRCAAPNPTPWKANVTSVAWEP